MTVVGAQQQTSNATAQPLGDAQVNILVADDHALFRAGLRHLLAQYGADVRIEESFDYEGTLRGLAEHKDLDLLLLDLNMPGMNGFSGLEKLRAQAPDVPIIVVSVRERAEDVRNALSAGAMGYIPKSSTPEVMLSALQLVMSGGIYLPPNVLHGPSERGADSRNNGETHLLSRLTPRQRDVLHLLAQGKSNKEIADELGLAAGTVKIHISRILRAFDVQNRTQAVIAAANLLENQEAPVR